MRVDTVVQLRTVSWRQAFRAMLPSATQRAWFRAGMAAAIDGMPTPAAPDGRLQAAAARGWWQAKALRVAPIVTVMPRRRRWRV